MVPMLRSGTCRGPVVKMNAYYVVKTKLDEATRLKNI